MLLAEPPLPRKEYLCKRPLGQALEIHWGTLDLFARVLGLPQHSTTTNWVASATEISCLTVWRLAIQRRGCGLGWFFMRVVRKTLPPGLPCWCLEASWQSSVFLTCRSIHLHLHLHHHMALFLSAWPRHLDPNVPFL